VVRAAPRNSRRFVPERHPRDVLQEHGIRPKKGLGQNFLVSAENLDRIVAAAEVSACEAILEIGTGMGSLTERLAARAAHVVSVEIDKALYEIASRRLEGIHNLSLLCCDFLASKHRINPLVADAAGRALEGRPQSLKVVSNLPYSISSPAVVDLLEWDITVGRMCLMLQKEVADRLTAAPGQSEYGPLTVYVGYWARVERIFNLPRHAFWPAPEVSSTLVKVTRRPERRRTEQYDTFAAVVRKLFESRRKTLAHILRAGWGDEAARRVLERLGLDPRGRVEDLGTADFEAIARAAGPPQKR